MQLLQSSKVFLFPISYFGVSSPGTWSCAWNLYPLRLQSTCVYRKWGGKTWKWAFCSDLFMVNAAGLCPERLNLERSYWNLKISGDSVFRISSAFCFVSHIAVWGFFWKYHRKSWFGELFWVSLYPYQNIQLSKAKWAWLVPRALFAGAPCWSAWWVLRKQGWECLRCLKRPLHEKCFVLLRVSKTNFENT